MKSVPQHMTDVWKSGDYLGSHAPMCRVTIQPMKVNTTRVGQQLWASYLFGQGERPREISNNVQSVEWERTIDSDVASCTVKIYNSRPTPPPGSSSDVAVAGLLDQPGYYTWRRGKDTSNRWGQTSNWWRDIIVPDRIMRTYEGYGWDPSLPPEEDPYQVPSGVWIIDDVTLDTNGTITISARDAASMLLTHICFPPVIPLKLYPLKFTKKHNVRNKDDVHSSGGWAHPTYDDDSGRVWANGQHNHPLYGHYPAQAFDGSNSTYWLSVGNGQPGADFAFEWVQGKFSSRTLHSVKARVWGGPYRAYLSVYTTDDGWKGKHDIPYNPNAGPAFPNGANIPFVDHDTVDREGWVTFDGLNIDHATKVRITLTDLTNSGLGQFPYRGGIRDMQVSDTYTYTTEPDPLYHVEGNYDDFTDIVKMLCAYGGFYWPNDEKGFVLETFPSTKKNVLRPASNDVNMGKGRVWGDFQYAGTWGLTDLGPDIFDKRPLMDGISYIRDITNFIFHVDETGGIVWRPANIWSIGNYIDGTHHAGTADMVVIDENVTLLELSAILSSRNVRENVFVANSSGQYGAVVKGHNPYPSGQRRVAGWSDQHFESNYECQLMADLITLRQLFAYQTNRIVIPGYPRIQIDDQIRIYEQVTSESLIHYVKGVSSSWDRESGKWTYTIDTHWLGRTPFTDWAFNPDTMLSQATKDMLKALGLIN